MAVSREGAPGERRSGGTGGGEHATATGTAPIVPHPAGTVLAVVVTPRAGKTGIDRITADAIRIKLAAAPVEGAANVALVRYLADLLDLPRGAVTLLGGETSRHKRVLLRGLAPAAVLARLEAFR